MQGGQAHQGVPGIGPVGRGPTVSLASQGRPANAWNGGLGRLEVLGKGQKVPPRDDNGEDCWKKPETAAIEGIINNLGGQHKTPSQFGKK